VGIVRQMGQKIHPLGFRLGVTQEHLSNWFARSNSYFDLLEEDQKIRSCIKEYVRKHVRNSSNYGGIARVTIKRKTDLVQVDIHTGFPALLIEGKEKGLLVLKENVQKTISTERKLRISLSEIDKYYAEAYILAEYIALQLENRVAFRRTMKKAIQLAIQQGKVKGIKIQIAGRLNGAEIARIEWAREGRVPLQTLRARIDYCHYPAKTTYGVLGIKVWIFKGED
jgi:small subunit ribosomal protein S3